MEDKNFILAVALCIGVYAAWFAFVQPRFAGKAPAVPSIQGQGQAPVGTARNGTPPASSEPSPEKTAVPVELRTSEAEIRLSPTGAGISSYRFHGPLGLVELVAQPSPGLFATWPAVAFTQTPGDSMSTVFKGLLSSGLIVRKEIRFGNSGALGTLRLTIRNPGQKPVSLPAWDLNLGPGIGTVASEQKDNAKNWRAIGLFPPPEGRSQEALEHLKAGEHAGPWHWLAIDNRYFLTAALPSPKDFDRAQMESTEIEGRPAPQLRIWAKPISLAAGQSKTYDIPFYIGPKSYARLESLNQGLERSVNFGWFDTLGRWMLKFLQTLHRLTGNYGWSIILLTILLQAALFPLTSKSLKSMNKMRKLQPEIARLQQKFKDEPQRLNTEMMALYKAKGINPMGGCLPMLAQMPIFVALFNALRNAWELHGAPWIFWVHDLSAHDPFYILPLLMGGVMFLQNRLNPAASADPAQAAMMTWMPAIFTFMFLQFPAGLVLYWLTNSILNTLQQLALRRQMSS